MKNNPRNGNRIQTCGSARVGYTLVIAFAGAVFCTGDAWIMPLVNWCLPSFGAWIAALPHSSRLTVCGGIALVVTMVLLLVALRLTRR